MRSRYTITLYRAATS